MDEFAAQVLKAGMLSSLRQDESVARQGVINHQTTAHLMDLSFVRDATELSIPESYAVQGLSLATTPRESQVLNLASQTPK
jgi:hypothetical protein